MSADFDFRALAAQLAANPEPEYAPEHPVPDHTPDGPRWNREKLYSFASPMRLRMTLDELTLRRLDRTVSELRGRGMPYRHIATVLDLYEGVEVSEEEVRSWALRMGAPKIEARARAMVAENARRRRLKVAA